MKLIVSAVAVALVLSASTVRADVVDLDSLSHGDIVTSQFAGSNSLLIEAENFHTPDGDLYNMAVIFDTTTDYFNGDGDPDLRAPWDGGNLDTNHVVGNVLIIQERTPGNDDGTVDVPDDEARRPAGTIAFDWRNCLIDSIAFTLVDNEPQIEPFFITFANEVAMSTIQVFNGVDYGFGATNFGDNHANRLGFTADEIGIGAWDSVTFHFGGSGGLGEIEYSKIEIPAPAALPAGLLGLAAFGLRRRKA